MIELQTVLEGSAEALSQSPKVEVPLGWRVRIWHSMNRAFPDDALFRRSVLSYVVAQRTLAPWETIKVRVPEQLRELPFRMIENCRLLITGKITKQEATDYDIHDVEYAMELSETLGTPAWCPLACRAAIQCASSHEEAVCAEFFYDKVWEPDFVEKCREEDDDWEGWDAHFWGACVAGGYHGLDSFDAAKLFSYWDSWLKSDVPSVLGDLQDVNQLVAKV